MTEPERIVELHMLRDRVRRLALENDELRLRLDTANRIMATNIEDAAKIVSTIARTHEDEIIKRWLAANTIKCST